VPVGWEAAVASDVVEGAFAGGLAGLAFASRKQVLILQPAQTGPR
jgi:hypothetical protein